MNYLFQKIFFNRISVLQDRNYNLQLLKPIELHKEFAKIGFVHLKNIFSEGEVNKLIDVYNSIKKNEAYEKTDYYINSVSFKSEQIKKYTRTKVIEVLTPSLNKFLETEKVRFPISVGYCINPANSTTGSRPHQDPNLVDETKGYSLVLWVSLCDTNVQNGCLHVLPGSHLWGNHIRSNFHVRWKFEEFLDDILWKNMSPVPTQSGDIICFDPALIHGSTPNKTNQERLGIQISLIPKQEELVSVIEEKGLLSPVAKYYNIDETYFTDEDVYRHPSEKFPVIKKEKINYYYTRNDILNMVDEYKNK